MQNPIVCLIAYCLLIVAASLLGGWVPIVARLTHKRMQLATSLVAGFMLGIAVLHLLPHAFMSAPIGAVTGWMLAGLLVMFFLERFFTYHHHDVPGGEAADPETGQTPTDHVHDAACDHRHEDTPVYGNKMSWSGAAVGLTLHSLIAGVALGASIAADSGHGSAWPGIAVFLVIVLHKPFDSMTLLTLMTTTGWSKGLRHAVNALCALAVPIGAAAFLFGVHAGDVEHSSTVGAALAFAAGVFLCVSLSDLLPELHFHKHDRAALSATLLLGLALAWGISVLEAGMHDHEDHDEHDEHTSPQRVEPVTPDTGHADHDHGHDHGHDHDHPH